jgi:enoyl-CoA hydratase
VTDQLLRSELSDGVAIAHLDDGKANAFSHEMISEIGEHLDRFGDEDAAKAVLIAGRPGVLSGGFDLKVMGAGPNEVHGLVAAGAELFCRFLEFPLPIVIAATGHSVAAGAIALLAADARLGAAGKFRIGLSEVAIGMTLPHFAAALAHNRLSKRHYLRATAQSELYSPEGAADAGYLDRVVPAEELLDAAVAEAKRLGELPQPAFANTKQRAHEALIADVRGSLNADLQGLTGSSGIGPDHGSHTSHASR